MVRVTLFCSLLSLCLCARGLHAQSGTDRPTPSNAGSPSKLTYREMWQQMHRHPASRRGRAFAHTNAVRESDAEASPNFAGFYTAPFISNVAPLSAGANRVAFFTADVNHDGHPDLLSVDANGGIAA